MSADSWPDAVLYREVVQNLKTFLDDPLLRVARIECDRFGLPIAYSGRNAVVFPARTPDRRRWALRFFTSPGDSGRIPRYEAIERRLEELAGTGLFVPFRHEPAALLAGGARRPLVAMEWAEGEPLGRWVEAHRDDPKALRRLALTLEDALASLEEAGIAHGDWQHDNLLVQDGGRAVVFVDYDGLYLPEFAGDPASERGHPNYQHPARGAEHFGPGLDRFACRVMTVALQALALAPGLWETFGDPDALLFRRADFESPAGSELIAVLRPLAQSDPALKSDLETLLGWCAGPVPVERVEPPLPPEPVALKLEEWEPVVVRLPPPPDPEPVAAAPQLQQQLPPAASAQSNRPLLILAIVVVLLWLLLLLVNRG